MLAANILGPRPQTMPPPGATDAKNFLQLKQAGLDTMGNALVELEGQFPFNLAARPRPAAARSDQSGALFGIGRSLYFCIPPNQQPARLLGHRRRPAVQDPQQREHRRAWSQQLPLFDPPLDPGMLVKAAAAGHRHRQHRQRPATSRWARCARRC